MHERASRWRGDRYPLCPGSCCSVPGFAPGMRAMVWRQSLEFCWRKCASELLGGNVPIEKGASSSAERQGSLGMVAGHHNWGPRGMESLRAEVRGGGVSILLCHWPPLTVTSRAQGRVALAASSPAPTVLQGSPRHLRRPLSGAALSGVRTSARALWRDRCSVRGGHGWWSRLGKGSPACGAAGRARTCVGAQLW